jgi:hypothetical protein
MILKSKNKTLGFWYALLGFTFGLCMLVGFSFTNMALPPRLFLFLVMFTLLGTTGKILWDCNIIVIDTDLHIITFKNIFTRISKKYSLDYFDSYIYTYEPMKFKNPKNIYLVKNGIFIKKISSFVYSNHSEIVKALAPIKSLGEVKYSHCNSFKIFIGRPIL